MEPSIFLDFNLPNAATWFYFSLILTVALFFQFGRVFSIRNLDLLTLFLLTPGFLLLQEAHTLLAANTADSPEAVWQTARGQRELIFAYTWLLAGSGYWLVRAIVDLALVRRPVANPNLNTPGLAWLGLALFFCLTAVAIRRTGDPVVSGPVGSRPIPIEQFQNGATAVVQQTQDGVGPGASPADVRFWVERALATACHLAVALGLFMIGLRHFQDPTAGMALGTLYLLLPYTAFHIGQFHLVWPAAFVTWAVFCYRRPVVSGWLLGLAAGSAFVPLLLFPLWTGFYARRGGWRFALSFASALAVSLGMMAVALWSGGWLTSGLTSATVAEWLPWKRPQAESLWTGVHGAYRLPIFVLFVAFLAAITVWPSPKNLSHLVALSAAVLIGVQFWHADRGGVYVLWYLPLVLLMVFRPNLTGHEPPSVEPGGGVMLRWAGAAWRRVRPGRSTNTSKELAV
ncbi:MAG: hypothetical protein JWO38_3844 [Gemmataceae bacterium]|nr:hypothetical protein [Gemmataceae bacterium]